MLAFCAQRATKPVKNAITLYFTQKTQINNVLTQK
ncbi:hypothetical protein THIAE_06035 [Thiomicrospira aerophila AL3]|uniref:Uncharacterized protein n=1 Tax=Thiomicrospira aerophila AL3 TaxID=717772 RepID=W0DV19_9GAMM|nr:hypothetical protein THIAE_06035 [Thiomicrospira aerophila AL3]